MLVVAQHCDFQCEPWNLLTGLKCCSAPSQLCHVGHTQSLSPELVICVPRENGVNNTSASVVVLGEIMCVSCQLLVTTGWWWAVSITAKGITLLCFESRPPLVCHAYQAPRELTEEPLHECWGGSEFPAARALAGAAAWRTTRESHSLSETETSLSYFSTSLCTSKPRPCALPGIIREAGQL